MNIYIPSHLRKLGIVDQMYKMLSVYESTKESSTEDSMHGYNYNLKSDPVSKFLRIQRPDDEDANIHYLSSLFYSVKGTCKVFEYMKKYLNLKFDGDIKYTTNYLEFKISEISLKDEELFYNSFMDFLNSLLYFENVRSNFSKINMNIEKEADISLGIKCVCYKKFNIKYQK